MGTCKKCGGFGSWFSVNSDGLCADCATGPTPGHDPLTVECQSHTTLRAVGGCIILNKKGTETTIPISNIQNIVISPPQNWGRATIVITTAKANSGFVAVTSGISMAVGGSTTVILARNTEYEFAKNIKDYVLSYLDKAPVLEAGASGSADEIRKYKSLFDDGIISQAEFDAAKKKLLGL